MKPVQNDRRTWIVCECLCFLKQIHSRAVGSTMFSIFLVLEHQHNSPKCNLFCAISAERVNGTFFINEITITRIAHLDILKLWLIPQLPENQNYIFQQDRWPVHFHNEVCVDLNNLLLRKWIEHTSEDVQHQMMWPPVSPDLTSCYFFLWG